MAKRMILWCVGTAVLLLAAALVIFLLTRDPGVTGNGVRFIAEGGQYAR